MRRLVLAALLALSLAEPCAAARFFDGSGDNIKASSVGLHGLSTFTITFWLKNSGSGTVTADYAVAVPVNTGSGINGLDVRRLASSTDYKMGIDTTGSPWTDATLATGVDDAWHHVAGSYDGSNLYGYWDGANVFTMAMTGTVTATSDELDLGTFGALGALFDWTGSLAEIAIYNRALDAAEVAALSDGAAPSLWPIGAIHYWPLVGRADPEIDLRGGLSGTVTNAVVADHPRIYYPATLLALNRAIAAAPGGSCIPCIMRHRGGMASLVPLDLPLTLADIPTLGGPQ